MIEWKIVWNKKQQSLTTLFSQRQLISLVLTGKGFPMEIHIRSSKSKVIVPQRLIARPTFPYKNAVLLKAQQVDLIPLSQRPPDLLFFKYKENSNGNSTAPFLVIYVY